MGLNEDQNILDVLLWDNVTKGPPAPKDASGRRSIARDANPVLPADNVEYVQAPFTQSPPPKTPFVNVPVNQIPREVVPPPQSVTINDDKFALLQLLALLSIHMDHDAYMTNPIIRSVHEKIRS
jgi:hypothetical protein